MDYFMWAKALLLCSKSLKRVTQSIDIAMDALALNAGRGVRDTYSLMERAADIIARKRRIINLRVITTDMLNSLAADKRHLITCRYILDDTAAAISAAEGIPIRSVYRRLNTAVTACADYLRCMGFDAAYFEERYGKEKWIMSTLKKFNEKEEEEFGIVPEAAVFTETAYLYPAAR